MNHPDLSQLKNLIGESPAFKQVVEVATKIAPHNIPILIEGESGTGKERLACVIHFASPRANHEFVTVDCSSLSDVFFESELLGYVRGSFAGAIHDKKGLLEIVSGGTIFFDHISQMKPTFQGKLLRIINEGTFYKIGGVAEIQVDIRFIAATDQDLKVLVSKGKFREDLYYQLNVMRISIPPLRERRDDILLLADWFLTELAKQSRLPKKELTKEAQAILQSYSWPGNINQLEKEIEKSTILADSALKISADHLSSFLMKRKQIPLDSTAVLTGSLKDQKRKIVALLEKNAIQEALRKTSGNRTHAAQNLSISRQELLRKISAYKIKL
ncbi:MAG: sigma-54-dependent Fis family transcriptional regulator [Candidatus Omnitrophica bacterium]|nr:sigma-54-dependent Fis family transcriptional regulator [Candidatus Omnitrophota bacterium]